MEAQTIQDIVLRRKTNAPKPAASKLSNARPMEFSVGTGVGSVSGCALGAKTSVTANALAPLSVAVELFHSKFVGAAGNWATPSTVIDVQLVPGGTCVAGALSWPAAPIVS